MVKKRVLDLDKVVDKATELITQNGLEATTMPAIAAALNIRSQSLYHYVANRHHLLSLVGAKRIKLMNERITTALVGLSGNEAILKYADIIRDTINQDKALARMIFQVNEYSPDDSINKAIWEIIDIGRRIGYNRSISVHALVGAILGYVFFDETEDFAETKELAIENYHKMVLRLVGKE